MGQAQSDLYVQYADSSDPGEFVRRALATPAGCAGVLGVRAGFSRDELKAAFRDTARVVHPDRGGTQEMFEAVTAAFQTLSIELRHRATDEVSGLAAGGIEEVARRRDAAARAAAESGLAPKDAEAQRRLERDFHRIFEETHVRSGAEAHGYEAFLRGNEAVEDAAEDVSGADAGEGSPRRRMDARFAERRRRYARARALVPDHDPLPAHGLGGAVEVGSVTPRDMSVEVSAGIAATDLVQAHAERRFLVTQEELDAMARRERRVKATASPDSARRYLARRYRSVDDRAVASSARRTAEMLRERELAAVESEREDLRRAIAIQGRVNQRCLVAAATDD